MKLEKLRLVSILALLALSILPGLAGVINKKTEHEWEYAGPHGASHWAELKPEYLQCSLGHKQSPINIYETIKVPAKELDFDYHSFHEAILNNGHTVELLVDEDSELIFEGTHYHLVQFHFHTPSEHIFHGKHYPLEMHLVHENQISENEKNFLVLAIMFEKGDENVFLDEFINDIPEEEIEKDFENFIDFAELLGKDEFAGEKFYSYEGSLTTPPCTEKVKWLILKKPVEAANWQISKIKSIEGVNSRPMQKHYERKVEEFLINID